jgi:hypothetical protein
MSPKGFIYGFGMIIKTSRAISDYMPQGAMPQLRPYGAALSWRQTILPVTSRKIRDGQTGTGTGFSSSFFGFLLIIIFPRSSTRAP